MVIPRILAAFALATATVWPTWGVGQTPAADLTVDFSQPQGVVRLVHNGLLQSASTVTPPDEHLVGLKPYLWRVVPDPGLYFRATSVGAKVQVLLSDGWGYPHEVYGWPFQDWVAWEDYVRQLATFVKEHGARVQWDVWNEPDVPEFWAGTFEEWLQTYLIAFRTIREVDPQAVIGGPSASGWHTLAAIARDLFDFCLAQGCEVNFLSWHELESSEADRIPAHVASMRSLTSDPRYAPLNIREIHINEVVGEEGQYSPGHAVVTFHYLEQAGVDAAARACWGKGTASQCVDDSLDGLLVPGTFERRSVWYAHFAYAQRAGHRFAATSTDPAVAVMASAEPTRALLLVGNSGPVAGSAAGPRASRLTLRGLGSRTGVDVTVYRIPNSGASASPVPVGTSLGRLPVSAGVLVIDLGAVGRGEAVAVVVVP